MLAYHGSYRALIAWDCKNITAAVAVSHATEIKTQGHHAGLLERLGQRRDDVVVHVTTVKRMRMAQDNPDSRRGYGSPEQPLEGQVVDQKRDMLFHASLLLRIEERWTPTAHGTCKHTACTHGQKPARQNG